MSACHARKVGKKISDLVCEIQFASNDLGSVELPLLRYLIFQLPLIFSIIIALTLKCHRLNMSLGDRHAIALLMFAYIVDIGFDHIGFDVALLLDAGLTAFDLVRWPLVKV